MKKVCAPYKNIWSALSLTLFHNPMCECAEHIHTPGSTLPPEASVTRQSATIFKPSSEKLKNIAVHKAHTMLQHIRHPASTYTKEYTGTAD